MQYVPEKGLKANKSARLSKIDNSGLFRLRPKVIGLHIWGRCLTSAHLRSWNRRSDREIGDVQIARLFAVHPRIIGFLLHHSHSYCAHPFLVVISKKVCFSSNFEPPNTWLFLFTTSVTATVSRGRGVITPKHQNCDARIQASSSLS